MNSDKLCSFMVVLYLALISDIQGQKFSFPYGIENNSTCDVTDWSSDGSVVLTPEDLVVFEGKVVINALHELCTVDLSQCPPENPPTSPTSCFCTSKADDKYFIHVGTELKLTHSGMTAQAVVPGRGALSHIAGAATIGTLPDLTEAATRLDARFQISDGLTQKLLPEQDIYVCPKQYVKFEVCVNNKQAGHVLKLGFEGQYTISSVECVRQILQFDFTTTSTHQVTFGYRSSPSCQRDHVYNFFVKEDIVSCIQALTSTTTKTEQTSTTSTTKDPTPSAIESTTTTKEPTTTTTASTTTPTEATTTTEPITTTETTTTSAPMSMCDMPRSWTKLPSGRVALTDDVTFGGNWTIIQRRVSGEVDFYMPWRSYESGFGDLTDNNSSYWLGLKEIYKLCTWNNKCELLIHLGYPDEPKEVDRTSDGCYYARYSEFYLGSTSSDYTLNAGGYSGTAGDTLTKAYWDGAFINGRPFSTWDRDHDQLPRKNVAELFRSGWWFKYSAGSNLNGDQWGLKDNLFTAVWMPLTGENSVTFSEMKVRRRT